MPSLAQRFALALVSYGGIYSRIGSNARCERTTKTVHVGPRYLNERLRRVPGRRGRNQSALPRVDVTPAKCYLYPLLALLAVCEDSIARRAGYSLFHDRSRPSWDNGVRRKDPQRLS